MKKLWDQFLDSHLLDDQINELIVYTDSFRFWLADGLLEVADQRGWKASVSVLEEVNDEEVVEIGRSFPLQNSQSLMAAIFSDRNPIIEQINTLFDPFRGFPGFQGYSILVQNNYPDQAIPPFLQDDLLMCQDYEQWLKQILKPRRINFDGDDNTSFAVKTMSDPVTYPYFMTREKKHMLFPSAEIVVGIEPKSTSGVITVNRSIGEMIIDDELVDPMGRVEQPFDVLIEDGRIVDVEVKDHLSRRFANVIDSMQPEELEFTAMTFGLSDYRDSLGVIAVDRLSRNCLTLGNRSKTVEINISEVFNNHVRAK